MSQNESIPNASILSRLSPHIFWDVERNALDIQRSDKFIIKRVLEYGLIEDWGLIKTIYGLPHIKNIVLKLKNLDVVTLSFLCVIFDLNREDFICYKHRPSTPNFWEY